MSWCLLFQYLIAKETGTIVSRLFVPQESFWGHLICSLGMLTRVPAPLCPTSQPSHVGLHAWS